MVSYFPTIDGIPGKKFGLIKVLLRELYTSKDCKPK